MKEKNYTLNDLMELVAALRAKDGCPWDQAQTHGSMKSCMLNEAKELVEGIDRYESTGDAENMCEELGDVLFQVAFHSQIAKEEGIFTIEDVLENICKKMIRRHPHVFGEQKGGPIPNWEEIKKQERKLKEEERASKYGKSLTNDTKCI